MLWAVIILVLVVSLFMTDSMIKQEKQLHRPAEKLGSGDMYLKSDSFVVTRTKDNFMHTSTSRTPINNKNN